MHVDRAHGCLLGQLAGDALGSLVKFQSPEEIRRNYPNGVRELAEGGTYDSDAALNAYQFRLDSDPFDCGITIATGLRGRPNPDAQANGAIYRALLGAVYGLDAIPAQWIDRVLNCHPRAGHLGVHRPRPECF